MPLSATFDNVNGEPANISGGTTSFVGSGQDRLRLHKFTSNGTLTIAESGAIDQVLLVGGGGGGGDDPNLVSNPAGLSSGGGGAGELIILQNLFTWNLTGGDDTVTTVGVTVGAGGDSGLNDPSGGANGGDTVFGPYTADGGGAGRGLNGGSGGGGATWGTATGGSSTAGTNTGKTTHYGNAGGNGSSTGGGGGGAGGVGQAGTSGGDGGAGYYWIDGNYYAGGGGGGDNESATSQGAGGAGGSGIGGYGRGWVLTPGGTATQNINGVGNTGSGGGAGGNGGSGVVVVVVKDPETVTPTYSLAGSPSSSVEGTSFTITATTTDVADSTILFYTINNGTTTDADFTATNGTITITSNTGTGTVTTVSGGISGSETFTVSLRTGSITGSVVATTGTLTITETPVGPTYPSWPTMPTYSEWQGVANTMNSAGAVTYDMTGSSLTTNSNRNMGAISLPDGKVLLGPRDLKAELYDPSTGTTSTITITGQGSGRTHLQPVLSTNGKVYIPPFNSSRTVVEWDPSTGTSTSHFNSNLSTGGYYGAHPLDDGRIIFKPKNSTNHMLFDPSTNTSSSTNITSAGAGFTHPNMCTHPKDGCVYMLPYRRAGVYKWDPSTDTFTQITLKSGSSTPGAFDQYQDAVLGADGKIYATPWNSGDIGIFDIDTLFFQRYDPNNSISSNEQSAKGRLGADGRIYMMPFAQDFVNIIPTSPLDSSYGFSGDTCTSTHTRTNVNSYIGTNKYWDAAIDDDGFMICCPIDVTSGNNTNPILRIDTNESSTPVYDFQLSAYTNNG